MTYYKKNAKVYVMKKSSNIIDVSSSEGIARIKLNQPDTYNALSTEMLKLLIKNFKILNSDNKTKVIIVEGLGNGFSAGHNLKEVRALKKKIQV